MCVCSYVPRNTIVGYFFSTAKEIYILPGRFISSRATRNSLGSVLSLSLSLSQRIRVRLLMDRVFIYSVHSTARPRERFALNHKRTIKLGMFYLLRYAAVKRFVYLIHFYMFQVNLRNEWTSLCEQFHLPKGCVNSGVGLKQIYLR